MFESVKQDGRMDTLRYAASLFVSLVAHVGILAVIVAVPLIFCGPLQPEDFVYWLIEPPPLPPPLPTPVPPATAAASPRKIQAGGGIAVVPIEIPKGILPEAPVETLGDGVFTGWIADGIGIAAQTPADGSAISSIVSEMKAPALPPPPPPAKKKPPVVVVGSLQASKIIHRVDPVYPDIARRARVSGSVVLVAIIDEEGNVSDLRVLSGHSLLKDAAFQAVQQWKYSPTILNGEPVPVQAMVTVVFCLQ